MTRSLTDFHWSTSNTYRVLSIMPLRMTGVTARSAYRKMRLEAVDVCQQGRQGNDVCIAPLSKVRYDVSWLQTSSNENVYHLKEREREREREKMVEVSLDTRLLSCRLFSAKSLI